MALMDENSNGIVMPVTPMNGGFGGNSWGGDGSWWILLLFILLGGWGNGFNGYGNGGAGFVDSSVQRGFDQSAVMSGITGINNSVVSGFGDVQTALCGGFAGVNAGIANGFAQAEIANNARAMSDMQQLFANQTAMYHGFDSIRSQFADCCCENRLASCQTQNTIVSESAATRSAIQSGVQAVLDKMCQDKIDEKNDKIVDLQNKLNMADFAASQVSQNNYLQNALTAQTQYFLSLYPPTRTTDTPATGA